MGGCCSVNLSLDSLFKPCVDCVVVKAAYVCQFEENLTALKNSRDELDSQKADVVREVNEQEEPGMECLKVVDDWCKRVDALLTEVDEILQISQQESRRLCLGGCCSWNCVSSYKCAKRVAGKLKEVEDEKKKGGFDIFVRRAPPKPVIEINVGSTVGMETLLDEAWKKMMQQGVDTIGIWGMGGVGKTTLLNRINNKLVGVIPKDFDVAIFVTVSKDYKKENVQESIWKSLGFNVEILKKKETHEEKVKEIYDLLRRKKFVLLLDDVWEPINLAKDIGVPEKRDGSKVVFTTRYVNVCGRMGAKNPIKVEPLTWEEAWELFQRKVGEDTLKSHSDIPALAEAVAKECAGLPIAIITVAGAMVHKRTPEEWKYALESLKSSASKFKDMEKEVFGPLKFSYDWLPNRNVDHKPCFLYCCLFPEDYKISKSGLVDYWTCENLCTTKYEGYDVLGTLVHACLLEEALEEDVQCVKMHDVVRDMALWLVGDCDENFLVKAGQQLTEAPPVESWGGKRRISLMSNKIGSIMEVPTCPGLLTLLLSENGSLRHISGGLFQSMSDLKTLDLSHTRIVELPPEISRLVSLEYLNVANTGLRKLPVELKMLHKLKYLNLERTFQLEMIPRQVISSLSLLQVLRFAYCGHKIREVKGDGNWLGSDEMVKELECLKFLNVLTVTIRFWSQLHSLSKNTKLSSCIQILSLRNVRGSKSINVSSFAFMGQLEEFKISGCNDLEELKSSEEVLKGLGEKRTFSKLRSVVVWNCSCLSELTWLALAPNLIDVDVRLCNEMKETINAEKLKEISSDMSLFEKLQEIRLWDLKKLESIYLNPLRFPDLKVIDIYDCRALKKLPLNSESAKGRQLKIKGEKDWWDRLEWEDDAAKSAFSSSFESSLFSRSKAN